MESVVFDGVDLAAKFDVVNVVRPMAYSQAKLELVPGRDGYAVKGVDIVPGDISFTLVSRSADARKRRADASYIASVVMVRRPVEVSFGTDDGLSYAAIPNGKVEVAEHVRSGATRITLKQLDAAMLGTERGVTVPSGGSVRFLVGGSYPCRPKVSAAAAVRGQGTGLWGLRLDDGEFLHVSLPTSSATAVEIDCSERTCSLDGSTAIPTLDSDWLVLEPGEHVLSMDVGTGPARVTFRERWLR